MKALIAGVSIFFAFLIDWVVIRGSVFGFPFSFTGLAALFLFWHIRLLPRVWLAAGVGILWDTFSLLPFGTYALSFFILSFLTEFFKMFFTNFNQGRAQWMRLPVMAAGFLAVRAMVSLGLSFM